MKGPVPYAHGASTRCSARELGPGVRERPAGWWWQSMDPWAQLESPNVCVQGEGSANTREHGCLRPVREAGAGARTGEGSRRMAWPYRDVTGMQVGQCWDWP